MSRRYRLTRRAEQDAIAIWLYIARDNPGAADKLIDRFTELYALLAETPAMGTAQDQYRRGLRSIPIGRYLIFYRVTDNGIEVYRILHGAQQLDDLL